MDFINSLSFMMINLVKLDPFSVCIGELYKKVRTIIDCGWIRNVYNL